MTTAQLTARPTAEVFRRFTWQEALVDYLPPRLQTPRAFVWVERVPLGLILIVTAALALRLSNTAFIDEALYINAGQDYLNHWLHGAGVPRHGDYLSGAPAVYPVLAALLDGLGGLRLVRLFSLACILATVCLVEGVTVRISGSRRAGLLAAAAFGLCGPVVFVGALATFDALCVLLLAFALWLGVTGRGFGSAVGVGLALAAAAAVKYAGGAFAPAVLALTALVGVSPLKRVTAGAVTLIGTLAAGYWFLGQSLRAGIAFTTSSRTALSPTGTSRLAIYLALDVGLLVCLALVGMARRPRGLRPALAVVALVGSAALLPVAQLRLGEAVSFDKHTAYAALFLAPLVGIGLAAMSRGMTKLAPVLLILALSSIWGLSRSGSLYQGWVPLGPVLSLVRAAPTPGNYLSSSTDALKYYTRTRYGGIQWTTSFAFYASGEAQMRQAIATDHCQAVILRTERTGSPQQDRGQQVLITALGLNPHYVLLPSPRSTPGSGGQWLFYRLTPRQPSSNPTFGTSSAAFHAQHPLGLRWLCRVRTYS